MSPPAQCPIAGLVVAVASAVLPPAGAAPVLTVETPGNGVLNADYTTSKLFVDEVAGTAVPVTVTFTPGVANLTAVEVYTNLNRRDRAGADADGDGVEDGVLPPSGDLVAAGSDDHYYAAYAMGDLGSGVFRTVIDADKTGAYRLTGRFKTSDAIAENGFEPTRWIYYTTVSEANPGGRRDHAIVVSPVGARDIRLYELNVLNIEAEGTSASQRSTFVDLHDGAGSKSFQRWNLDSALGLGVNWLWFQPVHPYGVDGRHLSAADINARAPGSGATTWRWNAGAPFEDVDYPYALGSPYAVKNFFEVAPQMSKAGTRAAAMVEFQGFVAAADARGVSVMLDAAFNHTAWDCEAAAAGVALGFAPAEGSEIRDHEARFYSRAGDYSSRASSAANIAPAPDRYDFGKWLDARDVFFGRYDALVANAADADGRRDEGDWLDRSPAGGFDSITRGTWRYFAEYVLFWLDRTGHPAGTAAADHHLGIDGLRCDFGQGLPPQAWEYIINKARARKWSFLFMAESLDGGEVTYRSNRHFDILNESILFALRGAGGVADYRAAFEARRGAYGQSVVLLNTTSHDEDNDVDPWLPLIRYAVASTVDGAPMIFSGQELGLSKFFGFDLMEKNFGKYIPHFKTYNSMMPLWNDTDFGNAQLAEVYGAINRARAASPALRAPGRYFLNLLAGGVHNEVWGVAKYEEAGVSPAFSDVVFAFVNTDRDNDRPGFPGETTVFDVDIDAGGGGANLFGIEPSRTYNVKNLAAYTGSDPGRDQAWLWGAGRSGSAVLADGILAELKKVPTGAAAWATAPYEPLFLKLYDVTPPPPPVPVAESYFVVGAEARFQLGVAAGPDDHIVAYRVDVGTAPGGDDIASDLAVGGDGAFGVAAPAGSVLYVTAVAISAAGVESPAGASAPGAPSPSTPNTPVAVLDPGGDEDGDTLDNAGEDAAGTDPFDAGSRFEVLSIAGDGSGGIDITFSSAAEARLYTVRSSTDLTNWQDEDEVGAVDFPPSGGPATTFKDANPAPGRKFYQVLVRKP